MVNEYSCVCLHGDRRPQERKDNLQAFKAGDVRFLICTDVAARGIDVQGVPFGNGPTTSHHCAHDQCLCTGSVLYAH